jgi:DNA-binding MarR family transcriptional regulator
MDKYDCLKLENQLCFPLYACSKEIVRKYMPFLNALDLTYTQYIALMVLWEKKETTVSELGRCLYLDSGTLTPLLKKLEAKELLTRKRSAEDERTVIITVTDAGMALREKALEIPPQVGSCVRLSKEDAEELYRLCYQILGTISE